MGNIDNIKWNLNGCVLCISNLMAFRDSAIKHNSKVDMVNVSADDLDRIISALEIYHSVGDKLDELINLTMRFHNGR